MIKREIVNTCINCLKADLVPARVEISGKVRGEPYTVEINGLKCPSCGYVTLEGEHTAEFRRLLADQYRAAHGFLTSEEIRERRLQLYLSQQAFADYLKRGVASVKRWEMGKIQDAANDRHIREMTDPRPVATHMYLTTLFSGTVNATGAAASNPVYVVPTYHYSFAGKDCLFCQQAQGQTISVSNIKYFSSSGSTATMVRGIERFAHA